MSGSINYQKELDKITDAISNERLKRPSLMLHSCCAPCSSRCLEYLREYFDITVFYYNPNISSEPEYKKRLDEEHRLIEIYNAQVEEFHKTGRKPAIAGMKITEHTGLIDIIDGDYEPDLFYDMARGYEDCAEGGVRCFKCYALRIGRTYDEAYSHGSDYVSSTLTISPLKSSAKINEIGLELEAKYAEDYAAGDYDLDLHIVRWLPSDFKKRDGFKRSVELSAEFGLYRQNYCGCVYSKRINSEI